MPIPTSLSGVMTALVTPFSADGESLDLPAFDAFVEWQIEAGVSGLVACGTTGETPTLSESEYLEVIRRTASVTRGRIPVIAGAGTFSTKKTIDMARAAVEAGADAVMVVMPYYNRPPQQGLLEHVSAVATSVKVPIILYNIPGRSAVDLGADATETLVLRHRNIIGIKDATGNVLRCQELVRRMGERLLVFGGDDALTLPMMACGARGVISTASNLVPHAVVRVCKGALAGDWLTARREHLSLLPLYEALFAEPNPMPVKAALMAAGRMHDTVRLPLVAASAATRMRVDQALKALTSTTTMGAEVARVAR